MKYVVLSIVGILGITALCMLFYGLSVINQEVELRNRVQAISTANEASLDTMWKVIKQKANISEKAVSDIKDMNKVYEELVEGRSGGTLFKMVTENYPELGQKEVTALYLDLMRSVEAERKSFLREQRLLVDVVRERSSLIDRPISGMFIRMFGVSTKFYRKGHKDTPESYPTDFLYTFVTSGKTDDMVNSGQENDIELFNPNKDK